MQIAPQPSPVVEALLAIRRQADNVRTGRHDSDSLQDILTLADCVIDLTDLLLKMAPAT